MNLERTNLIKMGNYIARQRKKKEYTQKELAEFLDVSDKTISKWEQGILAPDVTLLKPLAQILDTNIDSIINGEHHPNVFRYSIESKKIKLIILFLIITIIVAFFSFYLGSKGKCKIYKLESSGIFNVDGYLLDNNNESIILIEGINFVDTNNKVNQNFFNSASIVIYYDDKIIYNKEYNIGKQFTLKDFLNNNFVFSIGNDKVDMSKLSLKIIFYDLNGYKLSFSTTF